MSERKSPALARVGSQELARSVAQRAWREVPAYRNFLEARGISEGFAFEAAPPTDKQSYLATAQFTDLVGSDFEECFTIFSSSGSSGHPFYWPQLRAGHLDAAEQLRRLLEGAFRIHERRTLAIVGLALGSWIGGDHFSWALKNVAATSGYPFAVFTPGSKHEEIIAMLRAAESQVDQFLLVCCPSAIGHILLRAEQAGTPLPLKKMRFLVLGEAFPESLRSDLARQAQAPKHEPVLLSIYGSADTGVLGFESPASIALRRLLHATPATAEALGLAQPIPHFFHVADPNAFLEVFGGELLVTKWQGIPLVRYNLHDRAELFAPADIVAALTPFPGAEGLQALLDPALPPALLAITGRADRALILCGTNLTESMLDHAVRSPALAPFLTGAYRASIVLTDGRQRLAIQLETRRDCADETSVIDPLVYDALVTALGEAQPEFRDDWNAIYRQWDADPARRIIDLTLVPWPRLSGGQSSIKHRGISS